MQVPDAVHDPQLSNPDNGKVVTKLPIPHESLAAIAYSDTDAALGMIEAAQAHAEEVKREAASDPTSGYGSMLNTEDMHRMQDPRGMRDPRMKASAMFAAGDRVYHKKHREEAIVRQVGNDGRIKVKWSNGEKTWVKAENIVRL